MLDEPRLAVAPAGGAEFDRLVAIIRTHVPALGPDEDLDPHRVLREAGLTSMRAVDLLLDIEDAFAVSFPDSALTDDNFRTAASLWAVLSSLLTEGRPA